VFSQLQAFIAASRKKVEPVIVLLGRMGSVHRSIWVPDAAELKRWLR
jgi:hypothetical protein